MKTIQPYGSRLQRLTLQNLDFPFIHLYKQAIIALFKANNCLFFIDKISFCCHYSSAIVLSFGQEASPWLTS